MMTEETFWSDSRGWFVTLDQLRDFDKGYLHATMGKFEPDHENEEWEKGYKWGKTGGGG